MSRRGRKRRADPTMPAYIQAVDLPRGIYWRGDRRCWFTLVPQGERSQWVRLGDASATLAQLQDRLQAVRGVDTRSLDWLMRSFAESPRYKKLSPRTQVDYARYRAAIARYPTRAGALGTLPADRLTKPFFQKLVDTLELAWTPSKANHWLRYLRRVYAYATRHTSITINPCQGVAQAAELRRRVVPDDATYQAVLAFARTRVGAPYLAPMMELMYLCRLRSIEAITLTDDHATADGVLTNRRKGSRDNVVLWTPRLRAAWDGAVAYRTAAWARRSAPVPLRAADRRVLVNRSGHPVSMNAARLAWAHLMQAAITQGVITAEQRFGTHACKQKGITDTPGNRHDKQDASGHRSERMLDVYDHSVPRVPTSERSK